MSQKIVLYAVYVPPGRVRTVLDAMILFADPQAKHAAHVTVRGPYPDYQDPRAWSAAVRGQTVRVAGVGAFDVVKKDGTQKKAVYLGVDCPAFRDVWHKPDFPGEYRPHLTIYGGGSFAEAVQEVLMRERPEFAFEASGVEPIVAGNGPRSLIAWYDPAELGPLMTQAPSAEEVLTADDKVRLRWIGELAAQLAAGQLGPTARTSAGQHGD